MSLLKHLFKHYLRNSERNVRQVFYKSWEIFSNFFLQIFNKSLLLFFYVQSKPVGNDRLEQHIHFWLGLEASQDEATVAAFKTVELDDHLVRHRCTRGGGSGVNSCTPSKDFKKLGLKNAIRAQKYETPLCFLHNPMYPLKRIWKWLRIFVVSSHSQGLLKNGLWAGVHNLLTFASPHSFKGIPNVKPYAILP